MAYGRRTTRSAAPTHHKSMGSYQMFAWDDAMALAQLLEELYKPAETLKLFQKLSFSDLRKFENDFEEQVSDLIARSESQRPAALRRLQKEYPGKRVPELVLLYAIIGQARNYKVLEVRDMYRDAMAAGGGNRTTCEAWYLMSRAVAKLLDEYQFPFEVFDAYGASIDWADDDDSAPGT